MDDSQTPIVPPRIRPKVGWMFEGGGAKGAYSFAFAKKLHDKGVPMDAVSGTSVGALNAILFATNSVADGEKMWKELQQEHVLPFRLPKGLHVLSYALFYPHMLAHFMSGRRAWVDPGTFRRVAETTILLIHHLPVFVIGILMAMEAGVVGKVVLALLAFWQVGTCVWLPKNESPEDFRKLQAMANGMFFTLAKWGFFGLLARHAYLLWWIEPVPIAVPAIWMSCLATVILLRAPLLFLPLAFADHSLLRERIRKILQSPLRCPTYVTLTEQKSIIDPDFPHWNPILSQPGEPILYAAVPTLSFVPRYFELRSTPEPERTQAVLASTALPFGITHNVTVGNTRYIDGGMADNLPIRPLVDLEACDIVIWMRINPDEQPEAEDRAPSHPDPKTHWQWTWRREDVLAASLELDVSDDPRHLDVPTAVPWRVIPATFPEVLRVVPTSSLGKTLDFKPATQTERLKQGEAKADEFLKEHHQLLQSLIAGARLEQKAS